MPQTHRWLQAPRTDLLDLDIAPGCAPDAQVINGPHEVLAAVLIIGGVVSLADCPCRQEPQISARTARHMWQDPLAAAVLSLRS